MSTEAVAPTKQRECIRCTVCATLLVGLPTGAANHLQDRRIEDTTKEAGDEKKETFCDEQGNTAGETAATVEDSNNDREDQESSTSCTPFIALACRGRCQNKADNHLGENGGYAYYCLPDCWEHFLNHHWGIYSGLGQAHTGFSRGPLGGACGGCRSDLEVVDNHHGSLSMEESLAMVSPQILSKAFAIFHSASGAEQNNLDKMENDSHDETNMTDEEKEEAAIVRRITQELEEIRLLKCPSCHFKIAVPEDRGCDAGWCEHCGRALCLYCLTDCGDHPKTDPTANSSNLIGDAHDHVLNNDCGLTAGKGHIHSGKNLARYHERQFLKRVALRLKRVPESIRDRVCRNLVIRPESLVQMAAFNVDDQKGHSLTELRRDMENDKWEQYPADMRVKFLHAAYQGDFPMVHCLLEVGIPHNIPDAVGGETAMHFASVKGHAQVVNHLLEHGANPWQLSPPGRTPLDDVCNVQSWCDLETVGCLIKHCMLSAPAIFSAQRVVYPWLRPWPNGTTALSCAKENHPESPVSSYFSALQDCSYRLCKACATGQTKKVKMLLSNKSGAFPRPSEEITQLQLLPPAYDLVWVYNEGSGCTPLLDLCAKSLKLSPQHVLEAAKLILDAARSQDEIDNPIAPPSTNAQRLLQMRDFKFNATALHWLALDPRQQVIKTVGLFLQQAGNALAQSIDRRGQTPLDWARNYSVMPENPAEEDDSVERQRHIGRWEVLMLAWEEEP